jgi:predicted NAD/FAD-dependent oxidoreductase
VVRVLVVGAGMAGLCAARALASTGHEVLVLDKGRGVGGRMATRRLGEARCDHGAQFLTARHPRFHVLRQEAEGVGALAPWMEDPEGVDRDGRRWRGSDGMTAWPKRLAEDLEVRTGSRVLGLQPVDGGWQAVMEDGTSVEAEAVVLTAPAPQAVALLEGATSALRAAAWAALQAQEYEPCLAAMARLERASRVPEPGFLEPGVPELAWVADNQVKGISPEPCLTLHAPADFSAAHWEQRESALAAMLEAAAAWIDGEVREAQVHGWLYARPRTRLAAEHQLLSTTPCLVYAGDVCGDGRVEAAASAGWAAANLVEAWA